MEKYPKLKAYVIGAIDESGGHIFKPHEIEFNEAIPEKVLAAAEKELELYPERLCMEMGYYGLVSGETHSPNVVEVANSFF